MPAPIIEASTFYGTLDTINDFIDVDPTALRGSDVDELFLDPEFDRDDIKLGRQRCAYGSFDSLSVEGLVHVYAVEDSARLMLKQTTIGKLVAAYNIRLFTKGDSASSREIPAVLDFQVFLGDEERALCEVDENETKRTPKSDVDKEFSYVVARLLGAENARRNNTSFYIGEEPIAYAASLIMQATSFTSRVGEVWETSEMFGYTSDVHN